MNRPRCYKPLGLSLFITSLIISAASFIPPALSAERLSARLGPAQRSIAVSDLDYFLETGDIPRSLNWYARQFTPEQLTTLRQLLQQPFDIPATTIDRFTRLQEGEDLLRRLSLLLDTPNDEASYRALRAALILSAADETEGLTVANIIRNYPLTTLRINLDRILENIDPARQLLLDDDLVINYLSSQSRSDSPQQDNADPVGRVRYPFEAGPLAWLPITLELNNPLRPPTESLIAELYIPDTDTPSPLIVVSHGVGSDRSTFGYLAQHLASRGFAVAALDHPDTNSLRFEQYFSGFANRPEPDLFIQRPADITTLLDTLEAEPAYRDRLRLDQVGVVGQSLGGYTVLAAAGAHLNFDYAAQICPQDNPSASEDDSAQLPFNLSLLLQCRLLDLPERSYDLRDDRIAAVLAINPITSAVFGPEGMASLDVPTAIIASNNDFFAPAIAEQIYPFSWINTQKRHLAITQGGTHFTFLTGFEEGFIELPPDLLGPDPNQAQPMIQGYTTAFFERYLNQDQRYDRHLDRIPNAIRGPFQYRLTRSLRPSTLEDILENRP